MARQTGLSQGLSQDLFEFGITSMFPGYNSSFDKTNLPEGVMIRGSVNMYKKQSGTLAVRPGLLRRGAADATLAGVDSSFEWNTWDGRCLPVRICNGKLQVESDIVSDGTFIWYDLLTGLTTTRWVWDAWWDNTNKKDVLLSVDGTVNMRSWSGGAALFVSYVGAVITLDRNATTAGFLTGGGTVIINGTTYTYGGVSGSTLTGTSDASAAVANQPVFDVPVSSSNTPASSFTADFLKVIDNHVYVGSYSSRLVYVSKTTSYTDYAQSTPRVPGDGELITMDGNGKGIGVHEGQATIAAGTNLWYEVSFSQITVGTTLTEQTKVKPIRMAGLQAALGHEFIDSMENDLVYLDQSNQLRFYGNFKNLLETKMPSISLQVRDELYDEDFTGGHLRTISTDTGAIVYMTAPLSGRDYMFETRQQLNDNGDIVAERFWHTPQVRNISRFAVIEGIVYGHSNANPQLYQVWNTMQWHDDSPSDEPLPYNAVARFAYRQHDRRQGMIRFDKVYYEGYCTQGTNLYGNIYQDYQGSTSTQNVTINSASDLATLFSGSVSPSMGDSSLGDNPLGQGLSIEANDQEQLPKYRAICDVNPIDSFEYALEVYSTDLDSRWELLAIGTDAAESENYPVHIRK